MQTGCIRGSSSNRPCYFLGQPEICVRAHEHKNIKLSQVNCNCGNIWGHHNTPACQPVQEDIGVVTDKSKFSEINITGIHLIAIQSHILQAFASYRRVPHRHAFYRRASHKRASQQACIPTSVHLTGGHFTGGVYLLQASHFTGVRLIGVHLL